MPTDTPRPETVVFPPRPIPVVNSVDVLVVGGGTAGVAAAVAAARQGAATLLVERYGFLGGTAAAAPVPVFQEGPAVRGQPVIRGIYAEIKRRLADFGAIREGPGLDLRLGRATGSAWFEAPILQLVCLDMCEEAGARLLLHTYLAAVMKEGSRITHGVFANKAGLVAVRAQQFIDATADGDLAVAAGARVEVGRAGDGLTQPPSLVFELGNMDRSKLEGVDWAALWPIFRNEAPEVVVARDRIFFEPVSGGLRFGSMSHVPGVDASDPEGRTRMEVLGRRQALAVMRFFQRHVPGCEGCVLTFMGTESGVRESRRIIGDYVLTRDDVLNGRQFPDVVGCSTSWIDLHHVKGIGVLHEFLPRDRWFEIPYRALTTAGLDNLYTAGRCMSCTHEALGATRTIPTTILTGQAAGTAAGLAAQEGVQARELNIARLQGSLAAAGVFLGSAQPAEPPASPAT